MSAPAVNPPPAAEWRGVSRRFGGDPRTAPVLDNLHLAVRAGEFLTLLGPSGCGKTTALRLLSGLDTPDRGQILLGGQDVTALPPHRREVNQVFQSYALFPHLSVADNVAFGLRMKRLPGVEIKTRVARVAELLALGGLLDRRPDALSGGQRQRVAVARALVCEPKVLLLDEPLSALDARLRAQVRDELRALQRRLGMTFVFVTHDQEEALTLSDRVAVLHAGRLEQIGSPEEIYQRPASRFVAGFIGEANLLDAVVVNQLDSGQLVCQLAGGAGDYLEARLPPAVPTPTPGTNVTLLVRPEHIRLAAEPPSANGPNTLTVRVKDRIFQGAATTLVLDVAKPNEPMTLRAVAPPAARFAASPVGATLRAWIAPEDVILLVEKRD